MITNTSVAGSDAIYLLAKSNLTTDYTLCELRSWVSPNCSTRFSISGILGASMRANCEDPDDTNAYIRSVPDAYIEPSMDWKNAADQVISILISREPLPIRFTNRKECSGGLAWTSTAASPTTTHPTPAS